jgi:hypothetical protein
MTQKEGTTQKEDGKPKTPKAPRVNVLDDKGSEEEAPNAAFTAALELARQATSAPPQTQPSLQEPSSPEKQKASKPDRDGPDYSKVTYRVLNEAADAVEDLKLLLKRKYGFKRILLEEIVEAAILGIKQDLDEHQGQSILVQRLRERKLPENQ